MQCGCVGLRVALRVCRRVVLFPSHSPVSTLRPRFAVLPGVSHTTAGECAWGALCSSDAGVGMGESTVLGWRWRMELECALLEYATVQR